MILYKDLLTGIELFTDAFPMHYECDDDFLICVDGKLISRKKGEAFDDGLIGANPSQEEQQDDCCDAEIETESGIDVALSGKLEDVQANLFPTKKSLVGYLKKMVKKIAEELTAQGEAEQCSKFKKGMSEHIQDFVGKYTEDCSVFVSEGFDPEAYKQAPIIGVWSEDGKSCKLYAMKLCVCEEKC